MPQNEITHIQYNRSITRRFRYFVFGLSITVQTNKLLFKFKHFPFQIHLYIFCLKHESSLNYVQVHIYHEFV